MFKKKKAFQTGWHINPEKGKMPCFAASKEACPVRDDDSMPVQHFPLGKRAEADAYYEVSQSEEHGHLFTTSKGTHSIKATEREFDDDIFTKNQILSADVFLDDQGVYSSREQAKSVLAAMKDKLVLLSEETARKRAAIWKRKEEAIEEAKKQEKNWYFNENTGTIYEAKESGGETEKHPLMTYYEAQAELEDRYKNEVIKPLKTPRPAAAVVADVKEAKNTKSVKAAVRDAVQSVMKDEKVSDTLVSAIVKNLEKQGVTGDN